jgi:hypothetical protein
MGDVDLTEFRAVAGRSGFRCRVQVVLDGLDVEHAKRLRAAIAAPDIQSAAIVRIVGGWGGLTLSYNSLRRHRAKDCSCA